MKESNLNQRRTRQKYSPQFKDQVLARVAKEGVSQVAKDLGLAEAQLYSWRAKERQGNGTLESQKLQQGEMACLRRENERLQEENAFLKKVATYFTKESK
jgi:transposase